MRRYIQQLVDQYTESIVALAKLRDKEEEQRLQTSLNPDRFSGDDDMTDEDFMSHIADVEAYLEGPRKGIDQPLAYYTEIELESLPPVEGLSNEEAQALFEVLNVLIGFHGHSVELYLAEDSPATLYYGYLLEVLGKPTRIMEGGHSGHDCIYWAPDCEFGEYCGCIKEYWLRVEFIEAGGSSDVPQHRFTDPKVVLARRAAEKKMEKDWDLEGGV